MTVYFQVSFVFCLHSIKSSSIKSRRTEIFFITALSEYLTSVNARGHGRSSGLLSIQVLQFGNKKFAVGRKKKIHQEFISVMHRFGVIRFF